MVIKASAASEIRTLLEALSGQDEVRREAAVARLSVIGSRAIPHIIAAYRGAPGRPVRLALMRALERSGDPRAGVIARGGLEEGGDLAVAAIGVLRDLIGSCEGRTASQALDALMGAALATGGERRVRLAALNALQTIPDVRRRLAGVIGDADRESPDLDAVWKDALDGHVPDEPQLLRNALQVHGAAAALTALHRLVGSVRAREAYPGPSQAGWLALRGAIHQALALRGSRVALYDLRETIDAAEARLPATFLGAVQLVGDGACLEALATAYARAPEGDARWRAQLAAAFRAVATRERVTRRHQVIKRIFNRWPEAAERLLAR